ncbi:putative toxin-antitoxin system toxin component, PIN family [soil metagenome]
MSDILRVVLDTNVVFEGLTKQAGASGLVLEAWRAGLLQVCMSDALWYEYEDVFSRLLSPERWQRLQPVLNALILRAEFVTIYYTWRPTSPDPGDEHVIDCTMNANAIIITSNVRDFREAQRELGLQVMRPTELIARLVE